MTFPQAYRRQGSTQEWLEDRSNSGKPSGDTSLEVYFDNDDPNGTWTTHTFQDGNHDRRMNREMQTAIVIEGCSPERVAELTALIHTALDQGRGTTRNRILNALAQDDHLDWGPQNVYPFAA